MVNYLKRNFALSEQGAKDQVKAIISCSLTNLGLMFPVGLMFKLIKDIITPLYSGESIQVNPIFYISFCIGLLLLLFILFKVQYNKTFYASYLESAAKRITLAERLRKLPLSFFGKKDLADLTTTIMSDCAGLETAFSHFIPQLIGSIISTVFVAICLSFMNWKMTVALVWVIPVAFILVGATRKYQNTAGRECKKVTLQQADSIQECIETVQDLKSNNMEQKYLKKLDEKLLTTEKQQVKSELTTGVMVVSAQLILKLGLATVILVGSVLLITGEADILTFLVFMIAASRIYDPLASALENLAAIFASLLQVERMKEIENYDAQTGIVAPKYHGYDIKFENVGFSYNNNETVIDGVNFTAKQGEVTALVGPSGGGKSTAAKLAARFWDINRGKITLGGVDISKVEPESLLASFSVVFQDVTLFNNTVMENIRLGRRGATDKEVMEAAKAARCQEFIDKLPNGYQTMIGENGSCLSGGERQRISIARALLKDAPVILLDEATASLDVENETLIQNAISELIKNKTVLVIAHRMRTIVGADKIVVLEQGKVAQQGTHEQLMQKKGLYSRLWTMQSKASGWVL